MVYRLLLHKLRQDDFGKLREDGQLSGEMQDVLSLL